MQQRTQQVTPKRFLVTIKRLGINGEGIGYYRKKVVFIENALPGEVIIAQVVANHANYIIAKIVNIKHRSKNRITPKQNQRVGGLELAHLKYSEQLKFKADVFKQALAKFRPAGFFDYAVKPTLGMDYPYEYRNKAAFQVRKIDGKIKAGLYQPNSHKLVDLPKMITQMPQTLKLIRFVVACCERLSISIYDERRNAGWLKTLVVREFDDKMQLVFVTQTASFNHEQIMLAAIKKAFPQVSSIIQNVNAKKTSAIYGKHFILKAGQKKLPLSLATSNGKVLFELSAPAFFQLNTNQAQVLYSQVAAALKPYAPKQILDAYCGVGTIGQFVAKELGDVSLAGMDVIEQAIDDAKVNAQLNQLANYHYEAGTAEAIIPKWLADGKQFDAVIVDPPRLGVDAKLAHLLVAAKPQVIVYVTCNPATFARDLKIFAEDYAVKFIQPVDMFPQTARTEGVCLLELKK